MSSTEPAPEPTAAEASRTTEGTAAPPGETRRQRRERERTGQELPTAVLTAVDVTRVFPTPAGDVHAVGGVSLTLHPGELVALRGPSGSGKTTLLNLLGGLDAPTSGSVTIAGEDLAELDEAARLELRRSTLAFVFQAFGLVAELTARENVEVPLRLRRVPTAERTLRVDVALEAVGLTPHAHQRPTELSGGQQQRVGIARALVAEPALLLADEPTGQLDSVTGSEIMALLAEVVHARGLAALVATHDPLMLERADRVLQLRDGRLSPTPAGTDGQVP